ncbi:MAG: M14 family metallopeptidase, partial [Planctomycetota bacterium]|nr:M14 family metallopeptidase [Planctomycetota bacterium]
MSLRPFAALVPLVASASFAAAQVTTPEAHLGRPVGVDFELADWNEVKSYYRKLAGESPRVLVETVGQTTEGRDFLLATVSSEANLARLEDIRAASRRIADPRGLDAEEREDVLAGARPTLFISLGMHSTETAAPQFGMELVHLLATSDEEPWRSAREELVVLIAPCLNPDGLDHVVSWYRENVGTPYEASGLLELYQYYAGHDNNRDWFMLTQKETRIVTRLLYSEWFPQVYWDVHQQGRSRERLFVPPFRDPLNPNLDPGIIAGINQIGTRGLFDLTRGGLTGVSTGVSYDMWWNGGNRNVPVRHNIVGLLTEAASVNIASPVFLPPSELRGPRGLGDYAPSNRFPAPWPGGWWHLRDIIDYELAFARSLLGSLAREPRIWLENALAAAERKVGAGAEDAPRAWLIPSDNRDVGAVRRLADVLMLGGVELHKSASDFAADGRRWPADTIVIRADQPYGAHVKDLFEVQRYPEGDSPYDVAGWTLPFLLGVRRVEVMRDFEAELQPVSSPDEAVRGFDKYTFPVGDGLNSDAWKMAFTMLDEGQAIVWDEEAGGFLFDRDLHREEGTRLVERLPRIGVYSPWRGSMDEGWLRYVFDSFEVPYVTVRNEMVRAAGLNDFLEVLVIPSVSSGQLDRGRDPGTIPTEYARGLDPEGAVAVEDFVRRGGTLVVMASSAGWAIDLFDLPLEDVTRGEDAGDFSSPGSVLRAVAEPSAFTAGLPESVAVFFSGSSAWKQVKREEPEGEEPAPDERELEVLLRYANRRVLLSGWIREPEVIQGRAAWVRAQHGQGHVHLFGFRPQYRGWS